MQKVYIISGPAGVGKSTTATALAKKLTHSAYISGDYVSHMHINGRKKPWESKEEVSLIWDNILSLTANFIQYGNDVVIDFVTFPSEANWLKNKLKDISAEVRYVVLWTDADTLIKRDNSRIEENRMGERCLILMQEFKESSLASPHQFDTSDKTSENMDAIIAEIILNEKYRMD
ncbi:AAA family ATPase [Peribacillus deserti]|uniref:AAA family ATPase n=1 Tax=Peribacillus deserti TaxID=673318 RepID=A0A2N5M190_9BACI|nr:AAA family ATPase [Peribacillus deserti]PLT28121.1 hypothetical protein CUU66_20150 [Peribacillus deserti]